MKWSFLHLPWWQYFAPQTQSIFLLLQI